MVRSNDTVRIRVGAPHTQSSSATDDPDGIGSNGRTERRLTKSTCTLTPSPSEDKIYSVSQKSGEHLSTPIYETPGGPNDRRGASTRRRPTVEYRFIRHVRFRSSRLEDFAGHISAVGRRRRLFSTPKPPQATGTRGATNVRSGGTTFNVPTPHTAKART